jgi:tetratricopeptide (TPR) repeat protein
MEQGRGRYDEASKLYYESLEISRRLSDQSGIANTIHQLGIIKQRRGEYDKAKKLHQESLDIYRRLGEQAGLSFSP